MNFKLKIPVPFGKLFRQTNKKMIASFLKDKKESDVEIESKI